MAQNKRLTWGELRVGLFVLVGLIIVALGVFYVTGAQSWGAKYQIKTYLPEVSDLQDGSPVTLDGVAVGNVTTIRINPKPSDRAHGIEVDMRIGRDYRDMIRTDSYAKLVTEGLVGNRYITITRGLTGTVVPNNGTVEGRESSAIQQVAEQSVELEKHVDNLTQEISDVVNAVRESRGSAGKFIYDKSLYNHLDATVEKADALMASVQAGKGSIGKFLVSDEIYNKTDSIVSRGDDIMAAVQQQKGTIGKLVYDPAIADEGKELFSRGNAMLTNVQNGKGTLGKLYTDDSLFTNLRDASANIKDVTGKLNNGQGTFGKFFTDPQLYDNMTGLTGDMRLMIGDFRKNPKKFLHVKLSIF
ncbi:MAG TPA: MlaD family protein [Candidatus Acidoferrales bacterium]|nr:MlaD family protein [Candidatus Acidoferrales bacterium]